MDYSSPYPKRLIEVDLPIKRISAHARREKSIRHGHISTLHIWWARRPLAACRAVICAALWPDPADADCPQAFRDAAARLITEFANKVVGKGKIEGQSLLETCSPESLSRWEEIVNSGIALDPTDEAHQNVLRFALLDFIADFANWDNSIVPAYLEAARALTQAAHEALGGEPGTRPLVVDPFAGGGAIPFEALRVGADAFATDLNPVAVLLNKVVLEYIPRFGRELGDELRKRGEWVKEEAEKELAEFYPNDADGATPVAYLWARTIKCEGPNCGVEVPLIRSPWLARKGARSVVLRLIPNVSGKRVDVEIANRIESSEVGSGTVRRGSATCPCCGYTTPVANVRAQLRERHGGANDARLLAVVVTQAGEENRRYRAPTKTDVATVEVACDELRRRMESNIAPLSLVPDEVLPPHGTLGFRVQLYGMSTWAQLFTPRQLLTLTTLARRAREAGRLASDELGRDLGHAVALVLALCCSKLADLLNAHCAWQPSNDRATHLFARQAIQMTWDFAESTGARDVVGNFGVSINNIARIFDREGSLFDAGRAQSASAMSHPLPDDTADAVVTDPPYYDAVPYADLSDFFYVWLRRAIGDGTPLSDKLTPKDEECVVDEIKGHDAAFFERSMAQALGEARRVTKPSGIAVIVFAHKSTAGWEVQLQALIQAGWVITGSWPIDTEWGTRLRAIDSAALASSVHLVCRPRENADGSLARENVGDWRDVLAELPLRIHEWMPRLAEEGVVGADAIFACLGPALEIYSRFSRVEKSSGDVVPLADYLVEVWAAVSNEALSLIFRDVDSAGLEPDARLTAMWLWTLGAGQPTANGIGKPAVAKASVVGVGAAVRSLDATEDEPTEPPELEGGADDPDDAAGAKKPKVAGYILEFDAARKIAQGLGVHLEKIESVVEVKGDKARLLPVAERARHLFGKGEGGGIKAPPRGKAKKAKQKHFFDERGDVESADSGWAGLKGPSPGATALDRLHQAMILFGAGRGELMKRFLVDEGVGSDSRFWKLAQSLSALYPTGSDEKRWVDGVLARKKGLGF
ncbi:MAG TPA: DUF1156 domain-containing protein [Pirellulales bacterium]|nr:DUF1156 domain-containing protein [Pirellulales bacterium]